MFNHTFNILNSPALKGEISNLIEPPVKTRRLKRRKVVFGKVFQLHATRGWKCIGRVSK